MALDPNDADVFQLLKKLKDANGTYPEDLLASRRQTYLKQVAAVTGGVGLAAALKNTAKTGGKAVGLPPAAGTLLESLLLVAIVAEAGTVTYLYRDKIKEVFQSISNSPKVEQISNPPVISSPVPGLEISFTPLASQTLTETTTPEVTPSLLAEQPTNDTDSQSNASSTSGSGSAAVSTPGAPDANNTNGNKYGHTPIPERTKKPGSDNKENQATPKKHN